MELRGKERWGEEGGGSRRSVSGSSLVEGMNVNDVEVQGWFSGIFRVSQKKVSEEGGTWRRGLLRYSFREGCHFAEFVSGEIFPPGGQGTEFS